MTDCQWFGRVLAGMATRYGDKANHQMSSVAAPPLEQPGQQPRTRFEQVFGRARPAVATPVSFEILTRLVEILVVWRLGVAVASLAWGRLPITTQWPHDIDVMWLWRYSVRWDSGWYLTIASGGYQYDPGEASSVAYFPLFPVLIRFANALLPGSDVLAALVVVHLALIGALIYIYKLICIDYEHRVAWRTIYFLLIFPSAFFFSAVYNESLFLLMIAGSLYHARRGQWLLAGLFGVGASATKLVGAVLIIPLAVELVSQRGRSLRNLVSGSWILLAPAGAIAYFGYLQLKFGSFGVFFDTEEHWHRSPFRPVLTMGVEYLAGDKSILNFYPANTAPLKSTFLLIDTTMLWIFLAAGVILWLKHRPTYGALVIAFALVPALSGSPQSMNRYLVVLFPAFLLLGSIRSESLRNLLSMTFLFGLTFTTYLFVNGLWAG